MKRPQILGHKRKKGKTNKKQEQQQRTTKTIIDKQNAQNNKQTI